MNSETSSTSSSSVAESASLLSRLRSKWSDRSSSRDVFSGFSTPQRGLSRTASVRRASSQADANVLPGRLSTLREEGDNVVTHPYHLVNYFDCALSERGRLVQGILYVCSGFLLFNARRYGSIVVRFRIDLDVLLAVEMRSWRGIANNAAWLAFLNGSALFVNFRDRDRAVECIQSAWTRSFITVDKQHSKMTVASGDARRGSAAAGRASVTSILDDIGVESVVDLDGSPCGCLKHYRYVISSAQTGQSPAQLLKTLVSSGSGAWELALHTSSGQVVPTRSVEAFLGIDAAWKIYLLRRTADVVVLDATQPQAKIKACLCRLGPAETQVMVTSSAPDVALDFQSEAPQLKQGTPWLTLAFVAFWSVLGQLSLRHYVLLILLACYAALPRAGRAPPSPRQQALSQADQLLRHLRGIRGRPRDQ